MGLLPASRGIRAGLAVAVALLAAGCSDGDAAPSSVPHTSIATAGSRTSDGTTVGSGASSTTIGEGDPGEARTSGEVSSTESSGQPRSPQDLRPYGRDGDNLLWSVREELTRRCMDAAGFTYLVNPAPHTVVPDPIPRLSVGRAEDEGYRQMLSDNTDPQPVDVGPDASVPGYAEALDPSDENEIGCFERAYQQIFGDDYGNTAIDLFRAVPGMDLTAAVEASPDFAGLVTDWSTCMQARGFTYENPGAAVFSFVGPAAGDATASSPSADEIRVAVADASCRADTDFESRYETAYTAEYQSWLSANDGALQTVSDQASRDLDRIREVAGSFGLG